MHPNPNAGTAFGALLRENEEAAEFYDSCSATLREAMILQPNQTPGRNELVRKLPK